MRKHPIIIILLHHTSQEEAILKGEECEIVCVYRTSTDSIRENGREQLREELFDRGDSGRAYT